MEKIISVIVEEAPEGAFLVSHFYENADDGNSVRCADIAKAYRIAHKFDEYGHREVIGFTQDEWTFGSDEQIIAGHKYRLESLDYFTLLEFINGYTLFASIKEFLYELHKGKLPFGKSDFGTAGEELIDNLAEWDDTTPFTLDKRAVCSKQEEDGKTFYYLEYFDFKRK